MYVLKIIFAHLTTTFLKLCGAYKQIRRMVQAVPNDSRENHDLIFEVLESLLKSGTGYSFFWFII